MGEVAFIIGLSQISSLLSCFVVHEITVGKGVFNIFIPEYLKERVVCSKALESWFMI